MLVQWLARITSSDQICNRNTLISSIYNRMIHCILWYSLQIEERTTRDSYTGVIFYRFFLSVSLLGGVCGADSGDACRK